MASCSRCERLCIKSKKGGKRNRKGGGRERRGERVDVVVIRGEDLKTGEKIENLREG